MSQPKETTDPWVRQLNELFDGRHEGRWIEELEALIPLQVEEYHDFGHGVTQSVQFVPSSLEMGESFWAGGPSDPITMDIYFQVIARDGGELSFRQKYYSCTVHIPVTIEGQLVPEGVDFREHLTEMI